MGGWAARAWWLGRVGFVLVPLLVCLTVVIEASARGTRFSLASRHVPTLRGGWAATSRGGWCRWAAGLLMGDMRREATLVPKGRNAYSTLYGSRCLGLGASGSRGQASRCAEAACPHPSCRGPPGRLSSLSCLERKGLGLWCVWIQGTSVSLCERMSPPLRPLRLSAEADVGFEAVAARLRGRSRTPCSRPNGSSGRTC